MKDCFQKVSRFTEIGIYRKEKPAVIGKGQVNHIFYPANNILNEIRESPNSKSVDSRYFQFKPKYRRGVAPIIGTLLLVAIATIGGSMVFVFAQDSIHNSQISNSPNIEFLKIVGYDTRDVEELLLHDGNGILAKNCCGVSDGIKSADERIVIYIQNKSAQPITISELRFAGEQYSFVPTSKIGDNTKIGNGHKPKIGQYIIVNRHDGTKYVTLEENSPTIKSGEIVTIMLDLKHNLSEDGSQIKITTTNGNVIVSTLNSEQYII